MTEFVKISLLGGAVITGILLLRGLLKSRLPRWLLPVLWMAAALRLLLPFSFTVTIPAQLWIFPEIRLSSLSHRSASLSSPEADMVAPAGDGDSIIGNAGKASGTGELQSVSPEKGSAAAVKASGQSAKTGAAFPLWLIVWGTGFLLCAGGIVLSYLKFRRVTADSLPATHPAAKEWQKANPLRRKVQIRRSDKIGTPLTYGIFRPVILLPKSMNLSDTRRLCYVLAHEYAHIRRFDTLLKILLAAAACVHWFNPLVWVMATLAGRDMELACDEAVLRRFGKESRSEYALTLIGLTERRLAMAPVSGLARTGMEERIKMMMNTRKKSAAALILAVVMTLGLCAGCSPSAATNEKQAAQLVKEFVDGGNWTFWEGMYSFRGVEYNTAMCFWDCAKNRFVIGNKVLTTKALSAQNQDGFNWETEEKSFIAGINLASKPVSIYEGGYQVDAAGAAVSDSETKAFRELMTGSKAAEAFGWSEDYIRQNLAVVTVPYTIDMEYDFTDRPFSSGTYAACYYVMRADKKSPWELIPTDQLTELAGSVYEEPEEDDWGSMDPVEAICQKWGIQNGTDENGGISVTAEISEEETTAIRKEYLTGTVARREGWSYDYLEKNLVAVKASFTVTPYGETESEHYQQYYYLMRDDENSPWRVYGTSDGL